MMPNVLIRPKAENDLIQIWLYIAQDNPSAADRVFLSAEKTFESIASMPGMGSRYKARRVDLGDIRFIPVKQFHNYIIYYREIPEGIEIVRVLHGHMEKHRHLEITE
jgi:toxin ParE1/3/4